MARKSYQPKPSPAHLTWLHEHGFVQRDKGTCAWWKAGSGAETWYVWLHRNGGQAEIKVGGRILTRCNDWRDTAHLERFFGLAQYAAVGAEQ